MLAVSDVAAIWAELTAKPTWPVDQFRRGRRPRPDKFDLGARWVSATGFNREDARQVAEPCCRVACHDRSAGL